MKKNINKKRKLGNKNFNFGSLRNIKPLSYEFGFDRGLPIDRYYIEKFLKKNELDIHGRVLEIGDSSYSHQFGGNRVNNFDVLHVEKGNNAATIIGDLTNADHIPSNYFDCFICTQTLHFIYDVEKALQTIYRILKPNGILLATFPGISQISTDRWSEDWCWGFSSRITEKFFQNTFLEDNYVIESFGNVLTALSFLQGIVVSELQQEEMDFHEEEVELLITVRAQKQGKTE